MSPYAFDVLSHMNHFVYDGPYEVTNGLVRADLYIVIIRILFRQTLPVTIGEFFYGECDGSANVGGDREPLIRPVECGFGDAS